MGQQNIFFRERFFLRALKRFFGKKRFLSTNNGAAPQAFSAQAAHQIRSFSILLLKSHSKNGTSTIRERSSDEKNFIGKK
jgi:hypothetical protein